MLGQYLIECAATSGGELLPATNPSRLYKSRSLAVAIATKSVAHPTHQEVRVVHIPSREIVFRTPGRRQALVEPFVTEATHAYTPYSNKRRCTGHLTRLYQQEK
ncbi:hypothetical protein Pnap_3922 [Polaromonas naphthalenivorans CJ2]|uniref:Uncharacterized protein n=1 Tax=Polaromonas naphthalenivorans (strain CJ2) TaxID=365044 RepID=A1VU90_POLNA|nr:hypothetical protein Pnap_3922 [Polaromonas naphthalenivorans CJ2]